jgi:putative transcriptional regulator
MSKVEGNPKIDDALLELAQDGLLSPKTADKITTRILGERARAKPATLSPEEIRNLRERANMSQAAFASLLNVTAGYLSQLERGVKRPTGAALALLHVVRRNGVKPLLEARLTAARAE